MAVTGKLSSVGGRSQLERSIADALRRKFAITPRIRDMITQEVQAFCSSHSKITAQQLKLLQGAIAAKVLEHPDARRSMRIRSPRAAPGGGGRVRASPRTNGSRSARSGAGSGESGQRYGFAALETGGSGRPPLSARGRAERARELAEEVEKVKAQRASPRRASPRVGASPRQSGSMSSRGSGRVPWRGADRAEAEEAAREEAKSGEASADRRSARKGSRDGYAAGVVTLDDVPDEHARRIRGDDESSTDSADDDGEGDDHVSVESEADSEGEGERRVIRYGHSQLRTHLPKRPDEATRLRLARVERAVVRDPKPEVVDGIVIEALMRRQAKEEAAARAARAAEFRGLLDGQIAERKLREQREAAEDGKYGGMLAKQADFMDAREREEAEEARRVAAEELQDRIELARATKAMREREREEARAAEREAIDASLASDEAEKAAEKEAARKARDIIRRQMAENAEVEGSRKRAAAELKARERADMDAYGAALAAQEKSRRDNFAKAFGTPSEHHAEGEKLKEEMDAQAKAERRRERAEHAARMAKLEEMDQAVKADRAAKAKQNRADLLAQMAEKDRLEEEAELVEMQQLRIMQMRVRQAEKDDEEEKLAERRKGLRNRVALDQQMRIDAELRRAKQEEEKLAVAAKVYGIADDKELLSDVAKELKRRRRGGVDVVGRVPNTARSGLSVTGMSMSPRMG